MLVDKKMINQNDGDKNKERRRQERESKQELIYNRATAHWRQCQIPSRSIMRLAALNTRRASGLRARYAPRAIIVFDRSGHCRGLLLALTAPSALGCRWLRIHIHPSRVRVRALPTHRGIDRDGPPLELSSQRRFPLVPLLWLDVRGVEADAAGSAGSASGLR